MYHPLLLHIQPYPTKEISKQILINLGRKHKLDFQVTMHLEKNVNIQLGRSVGGDSPGHKPAVFACPGRLIETST